MHLTYISQEEVLAHWPILSQWLAKYWDTTINFETLPNLKQRLLANKCQLFMHSRPEQHRFLFVTEYTNTATSKILTVTHTAGENISGKRWGRKALTEVIDDIFSDVEDMAKNLGFDAVCIHARDGHVAMAKGYEVWTTSIIKQL